MNKTVKKGNVKSLQKPVVISVIEVPPTEQAVKVVEGIKLDPQEFKGVVSEKVSSKQGKTEWEVKRDEVSKAIQEHSEAIKQVCKLAEEHKCTIQNTKMSMPMKLMGKNVCRIIPRQLNSFVYFKYEAIPAEILQKHIENKGLELIPDEWRWALNVRLSVCKKNIKLINELLDYSVAYLVDKCSKKKGS